MFSLYKYGALFLILIVYMYICNCAEEDDHIRQLGKLRNAYKTKKKLKIKIRKTQTSYSNICSQLCLLVTQSFLRAFIKLLHVQRPLDQLMSVNLPM